MRLSASVGAADPDFDLFGSSASAPVRRAPRRPQGILAAVSGGPDSIALMHLLARWTRRGRPRPSRSRPSITACGQNPAKRPLSSPRQPIAWFSASESSPGRARKPRAACRRQRAGPLRAPVRARPAGSALASRDRPYPRRPGRDGADADGPRDRACRGSPACARTSRRDGILHVRPFLGVPKAALDRALPRRKAGASSRIPRTPTPLRPRAVAQDHAGAGRGGPDGRSASPTLAGGPSGRRRRLTRRRWRPSPGQISAPRGQVLRLRRRRFGGRALRDRLRVLRARRLPPLKSAEEPAGWSASKAARERLREAVAARRDPSRDAHRAPCSVSTERARSSFAHEPARRRGRREHASVTMPQQPPHSLGKREAACLD